MRNQEPVFVIHGVNNRDKIAFENQVQELERGVKSINDTWRFRFIPVYWGDIGEQDINIASTIPNLDIFSVRSNDDTFSEISLDVDLITDNTSIFVDIYDRLSIVTNSTSNAIENQDNNFNNSDSIKQMVIQTIENSWEDTKFLKQVTNIDLLEQIGYSIGSITGKYASQTSSQFATRGDFKDVENFCRHILSTLDQQIGSILGKTIGSFNSYVRLSANRNAAFLSDLLVYQRHSNQILSRARRVISGEGVDYGTQEKPINLIAHSLGGIISFDLAISDEQPLWVNKLITFGSQVAVLHLLDPRGGVVQRHDNQNRIILPQTIKKWTNFWESLDPLAFIVSSIFTLSSGEQPIDKEIKHRISDGLWTHSCYWNHPELISWIRRILNSSFKEDVPSDY